MQQFKAASLVAFSKALRLRLRMRFGRFMQFVLPNGTTLPPTREAGLVQIAMPQVILSNSRVVEPRRRPARSAAWRKFHLAVLFEC